LIAATAMAAILMARPKGRGYAVQEVRNCRNKLVAA
jgi:hypothetical protein